MVMIELSQKELKGIVGGVTVDVTKLYDQLISSSTLLKDDKYNFTGHGISVTIDKDLFHAIKNDKTLVSGVEAIYKMYYNEEPSKANIILDIVVYENYLKYGDKRHFEFTS